MGIRTLDTDKVKFTKLLHQVLLSHDKLDQSDRKWVIQLLLGLNLSHEKLTNLILMLFRYAETGKYCLTYNLDFDMHVKSRDKNRIISLVHTDIEQGFVELYDNKYLTDEMKIKLEENKNIEYYSILNTIYYVLENNRIEDYFPNKFSSDCVYNRCRAHIFKDIGKDSYIVENYHIFIHNGERYRCNILVLLGRLSRKNYKNPVTEMDFTDDELSDILNLYKVQLKLYLRYLKSLIKNGYN